MSVPTILHSHAKKNPKTQHCLPEAHRTCSTTLKPFYPDFQCNNCFRIQDKFSSYLTDTAIPPLFWSVFSGAATISSCWYIFLLQMYHLCLLVLVLTPSLHFTVLIVGTGLISSASTRDEETASSVPSKRPKPGQDDAHCFQPCSMFHSASASSPRLHC
jgi:hypothetical protein